MSGHLRAALSSGAATPTSIVSQIYAAIEAEKKLWDSEKATAGDTKK